MTLFDVSLFADRGWIRGQRLQDYVNSGVGQRPLEQLPRKAVVVATQRGDKKATFFASGNTGVAVRASSAVPGVFSPIGIQGTEYEDGDESLPLAVQAAGQTGAKFVIAVDVSAHENSTPENAPVSMRLRDMQRRSRINPEVAQADFLIHPDLGYYASPLRSYFESSLAAGEATARKVLPQLKAQLLEKRL